MNNLKAADRREIAGLLFDKDGTLFDYRTTWVPWAQRFITELSAGDDALATVLADALEFDRAAGQFLAHSRFIAGTCDDVMATVLSAVPNMTRESFERFYHDTVEQARLQPAVPLEPLLTGLSQRGIKLGVATNDYEAVARGQLRKAGVERCFDFIAGYDSGFGAKPEPGMQHGFCEAMGLPPHSVAMVGDTLHDLQAGKRAGMVTIGVLTGTATAAELAPLADLVLTDIGEIPNRLAA